MKVKELIKYLSKCDPNAKVEIDGYDGRYIITKIEETFYSYPENKYVEIFSDLSKEPPNYQKHKDQLEKCIHKINQIRKLIG